jgi:UDP-glucose 4-epimerase
VRVLVTGASGFIGSRVGEALERRGDAVVRFIRSTGDVRDAAAVRRACQDCDGVVHAAAMARPADVARNPAAAYQVNVRGTQNALQAAQDVGCRWFVLLSSFAVYGQQTQFPVTEWAKPQPAHSDYGWQKWQAESLVQRSPLRTAILRLGSVYGGRCGVVAAFVRAVLEGRPLEVQGAGTVLDFVHVDDVVTGILSAADRLAAGSAVGTTNLTGGHGTSLGELARLVIATVGRPATMRELPPLLGSVTHFVGDATRVRELLGWTACVQLRDGLRRLTNDYRAGGPR